MKMTIGHRVGNMIQALINIIENLIIFFSFSSFMPNFVMRFCFWRLDTWFYNKGNKP